MSKTAAEHARQLSPADLPTPPAVALRIIEACGRNDLATRELTHIVTSDPAFHAELLRLVNSPYFGLARSISNVNQAVVVLGQRVLRNLALCFALRETVNRRSLPGFEIQAHWEESLRRAVSARLLARHAGVPEDEAFAIGMLLDIGVFAIVLARPEHAAAWEPLRRLNPEERLEQEQILFGTTHDRTGATLAQSWDLPPVFAAAIAAHHAERFEELPGDVAALARVSSGADWMAAVYDATDTRLTLARCRKHLGDVFGCTREEADQLLAAVPPAVEAAAAALGVPTRPQPALEQLVLDANRRLILASRDPGQLEHALDERERLLADLEQAYERLSQLAYYDPLTALVNRRRFEELCVVELARHRRVGRPMSLVMLDLDGFKQINDTHGHPVGDAILQAVAQALRASLRSSDVAARVGGEELCLLLPETDAPGGVIAAERAREAVQTLSVEASGGAVRVTASFGGITWLPGDARPAAPVPEVFRSLLKTADQALYTAKRGGRNRVQWA